MATTGEGIGEQQAGPTGVNRLDPWMRRHPQYVAGLWAFFALTSAFLAFVTREELGRAVRIGLSVASALLAVREVRRYRARSKDDLIGE